MGGHRVGIVLEIRQFDRSKTVFTLIENTGTRPSFLVLAGCGGEERGSELLLRLQHRTCAVRELCRKNNPWTGKMAQSVVTCLLYKSEDPGFSPQNPGVAVWPCPCSSSMEEAGGFLGFPGLTG